MPGWRRVGLPLLSGVLVLACSGSVSASTVVAEGVLRDGAGLSSAGSVRLYAWPHHDAAISLPLVGEARVDVTGRYRIRALDERRLAALAAQRDGWLDFIAYADTPGHQGQRVFTSFIAGRTRAIASLAPRHVSGSRGAMLAAGGGRVPSIDITTDQRVDARGRLAQTVGGEPVGHCKNEPQTQPTERRTAWTVVGELNNAYNDGTMGRFSYAREQSSDTWVGVGWSNDSGDSWSIDDENYIADSGKLSFPWVQRRYARKLRTNFEYVREVVRRNTCAEWDIYVRATQWLPATDDSIRQRGTLDRCDATWIKDIQPGGEFERNNETATRYTRAVSVFGVTLTSQSGFSREVTLEYVFGGRPGKKHYICGGADGRESAATAGRVWSGAFD